MDISDEDMDSSRAPSASSITTQQTIFNGSTKETQTESFSSSNFIFSDPDLLK